MPFLDVVGRYPEGTGSEETSRRTVSRAEPVARPGARGRAPAFAAGLGRVTQRRWRLQTAGLGAIALLVLLMIALPLRSVRIAVDGRTTTAHSRTADNAAIVQGAGVRLRPGDRIESNGNTIVVRRASDVRIAVDDKLFTVRSQAQTIDELLQQTGVAFGGQDSVLRDGVFVSLFAPLRAPTGPADATAVAIEVRRAIPFTVIEGGQQLQLRSSRETVAIALRDGGVRLGAGDGVQPPLNTALTAGLQVHIQHASQLVVTQPEGKSIVYTLASTVGEAITRSGLALPADYRLDPAADTTVNAGLAVHVVGISQQQELETERIQSYVVYEPDPHLPPGTQRVVPGQDGVQYRQFDVVSEDGVQVSRDISNDWYDPAPVDTVIYYSTARPAPVAAAQPATGDWRDLVCSYNWDCNWAMAVIACESGGNPDAYNSAGYVGLFQVWEGYGANLRDPATNVAAAYSLYVSGGRGNWPNCP